MPDRSYLGIDGADNNEWIVVHLVDGKIGLPRIFKNTSAELASLVRFISEDCSKPRICLKPRTPGALKLLRFIAGIPDVEVVLISEEGLRMHRSWLSGLDPDPGESAGRAAILARCAERMI